MERIHASRQNVVFRQLAHGAICSVDIDMNEITSCLQGVHNIVKEASMSETTIAIA